MNIIIQTILLLTLFTVLGIIIHYFKFFTNSKYRAESKLKDSVNDKLDELYGEIGKCKTDIEISEKINLNSFFNNFSIINYQEKINEFKAYENDLFSSKTDVYTLISASFFSNSESQLKYCFGKVLKGDFNNSVKEQISIGIKIIDELSKYKNKFKEQKDLTNYIRLNMHRLKYSVYLKILREDAKSQFVDLTEFKSKNNYIDKKYTLDNIYNKIETDIEFLNFCKKISLENKEAETYLNTMLMISILEKLSIDINNSINKLNKDK